MIGFRPKPNALFLERPRLLRMLPEEPGYIVWLEAPYGYGKSVLVSQWANRLEGDGWRVVWLGLVDGDPRMGLTIALELPDDAPWQTVLRTLEQHKTVVILEDLENDPGLGGSLGPLLKHHGLVLLASRRKLSHPELLRADSEGRLVHLHAEQLAFTEDEARALFGDQDSNPAWQHTKGWSLPLHMAALTGKLPDADALWEGVYESLETGEWQEILLLAALPYLPTSVANDQTRGLANLGFVQALENGFRLHPLVAETIFKRHNSAVMSAVETNLARLPLHLQAEACARSGLLTQLEHLLENVDLAAEDSAGVLRWHALCQKQAAKKAVSPARLLTLSWAYSVTGQHQQAMQTYLAAARHPKATPAQRLEALGWALFDLGANEADQADSLFTEAKPWLEQVEASQQAVFFGNGAAFYIGTHRWQEAEILIEQALPLMKPERRSPALSNLALVRWEQHGDLLGHIEKLEANLLAPDNTPYNLCSSLEWLGRIHALLNQPEVALKYFDQLQNLAEHNPPIALIGRIEAASIRGQLEAFPNLLHEAETWHDPQQLEEHIMGFVHAHWAALLQRQGRITQAQTMLEQSNDSFRVRTQLALIHHAQGQSQQAHALLSEALKAPQRWHRMLAWAALYRISRDPVVLEQLLAITNAHTQILPALIPLDELPRNRPEYTIPYPLVDVLSSGWREAIQHRQVEIPNLELRVLGGFEVRLLGQVVQLTARPKDIMVLLALRLPRDRIAEILWPEADTEKSRNNLHVNLNALRKAIEPWGVATHLLESGLARVRVDLWELEAALARGDVAVVRRLYAEFTPGFDFDVVTEIRDNLRQRVLEQLLEHGTSPHVDAESSLETMLRIDPLNAEAFGLLLERMVQSGRRVSAERRYREFTQRLQLELGLEPDAQTQKILGLG